VLIRQGAELARQTAETLRELREDARLSAEVARAAAEATRQAAEDSRRIDQGPSGRKAGQHLLYLFGELCRLANYLPAHLMATATRV
jgi:hypothetical protein